MIIGLTGLNGSGKGAVADYLIQKKGFVYHSLSDAVREEVLKTDQAITRDTLIVTANNLRKQYGASILAERIIEKLDVSNDNVVDSFRNPEEIKTFKKNADFKLWCVVASQETRFNRLKARKRENDPQDFDEFKKIENKELTSTNPSNQNLLACQELADIKIPNDKGIEELNKHIDIILGES